MESVIIACPVEFNLELKSRLEYNGYAVGEAETGLFLSDGISRVYISRNDTVRNELEPERLKSIKTLIPDPVFYTVDFSDIVLCKKILEIIADNPNILVDNDHGLLLPGMEFVEMLRKRRDWDWRADAV